MSVIKRKNKKVFPAIIQTVVEFAYSVKYGIVKELNHIAAIMQLVCSILLARSDFDIIELIFAYTLLGLVTMLMKEIGYKLNSITDRGIPIPDRRFVKIDNHGFISIDEEDIQEAMLYLNDVEEYISSKGWLK